MADADILNEIELNSLWTVHGVHNRRNIIGLKGMRFFWVRWIIFSVFDG